MARPKKIVEETKEVVTVNNSIDSFDLSAEIVAGKLTSNAQELAGKIKAELKNYSVEKYVNDPEAAKKDKALLTKVKTVIADKRKEVTTKWNEPLNAFLDEMKSLEVAVGSAYNELNNIVKQSEDIEKENKRKEIENYWNTLGIKLITLEKIFNQKWLNKTFKLTDVMIEIESRIEKINTELSTLKSMDPEDSEILQAFYLETLDLNATLTKGNELKANRERVKAAEIAKAVEIVKNEFQGEIVKNPQKIEEKCEKTEEIQQKNVISEEKIPILNFTLKLFGTKDQLIALRKYIDASGIRYEKVQ